MNIARLPMPWKSPKTNPASSERKLPKEPVGYLINHQQGIRGTQGQGYDYVLAGNGVYVQAEGPDLTARVRLAECRTRGLEDAAAKMELRHGKIPGELLAAAIFWFQETPDRERYFAVHWDGKKYITAVPEQTGGPTSLKYQPLDGMTLEFHSHGRLPAFFSGTDDQDEQGFRLYGVVGRLEQPEPEVRMRVGIYGHFQEIDAKDVFQLGTRHSKPRWRTQRWQEPKPPPGLTPPQKIWTNLGEAS